MVDRRHFLLGAAGAAMLPFVSIPALADTAADLGAASQFRERVTSLLAALQPGQKQRAMFPFGGDVQRNWNFMGIGGFIKPGLRLEEMDAAQKERAWDVLSSVMSPRGIEKTRDVMTLQQVLIDQGNGAATRGRERFSFAIFGEPSATGNWAMRYEGHHLSLTFNVSNDRLTGVTPSSFSVNPNRVENGNFVGLVTLKREDAVARKLAADLSGPVKERAFFMQQPFRNIRALAGREQPFDKREGIAIGDLGSAQRDLVIELVDAFAAEHLQPQHASEVARRVQSGDAAATHFGFAGSTNMGEPAYYRIHGDHLLIEFASVDEAAQHLHTIFHLS